MLDDLDRRTQVRVVVRTATTTCGTIAVLLVAYAISPSDSGSAASIAARIVVALGVFAVAIALAVRSVVRARYPILRAVETISSLVGLLVIGFASVYLGTSATSPEAFSEPLDHTSALYFALTTATTVGFGDIAPRSDPARIAVMVQMIGNVIVIGVTARLLINTAQRRRQDAS